MATTARTGTQARFALMGALAAFACLAGCASAPATKEGDLDVLPKANKHYVVDGATISFADLEARVVREAPKRLIVETARERNGTACVVMLGFRHDIPVWSRWPKP